MVSGFCPDGVPPVLVSSLWPAHPSHRHDKQNSIARHTTATHSVIPLHMQVTSCAKQLPLLLLLLLDLERRHEKRKKHAIMIATAEAAERPFADDSSSLVTTSVQYLSPDPSTRSKEKEEKKLCDSMNYIVIYRCTRRSLRAEAPPLAPPRIIITPCVLVHTPGSSTGGETRGLDYIVSVRSQAQVTPNNFHLGKHHVTFA